MNFLENIFRNLQESAGRPLLQEVHGDQMATATGGELLSLIQTARLFLRRAGLKKGERCVLLAPNSIRWTALDLAIIAEGGIVVPLYSRQALAELVEMMQDSFPVLICCGDVSLRTNLIRAWPEAPPSHILKEIFENATAISAPLEPPRPLAGRDPVAIIYTSGTSGEPKGAMLSAANLSFMLQRTTAQLDLLMGPTDEPERVFHYLPFCFAASWLLLLSCLSRHSILSLSTDLNRLAEEMRLAAPDYCLNVPVLLERIRARIEAQMDARGDLVLRIISRMFHSAQQAWLRRHGEGSPGGATVTEGLSLALARALIFPAIRKKLGPNLKAVICGSAPLARDTQLFFMMLEIPVLQVYGLTETTGICTMDDPRRIRPGYVGSAIDGIEMKLGNLDEILVRGPSLFLGYWNRTEATAEATRDGWFHSGDQGEVTEDGYWRITGRIKNLIVLSSGHNVAPEPIEEKLLHALPDAQQVVVIGNGRSFLTAIVTGEVSEDQAGRALEAVNPQLPHYKRVHAFHLLPEPFSMDNGLLTVNGKLKRDAIALRYCNEIEALYPKQSV